MEPQAEEVVMTDTQREKVYIAERALQAILNSEIDNHDFYGQILPVDEEKRFGSIESVQTYVDAVMALNWVRGLSKYAEMPVKVRARRGRTNAHYEPLRAVIAVPDHQQGAQFSWAMREFVVLHELAHHLTRYTGEPHGEEFAGTLLVLVKNLIGDSSHLILLSAFAEGDVKFKHYDA